MNKDLLKILAVESSPKRERWDKSSWAQLRQAEFERAWQQDPQQFNPHRNCMEKERIARTRRLITASQPHPSAIAVDLGSGFGELTCFLKGCAKTVWAVDSATLALDQLDATIIKRRETVPFTDLPDRYFDLVLCTDLIGYLPDNEQRLLFTELARICKKEGIIICSAPLDIYTEGALERFAALAETELEIKQHLLSYHRLWIRLHDLLEGPKKRLEKKRGWQSINKLLFLPANTLLTALCKSHGFLLLLERLSKFIWDERGISHILIAATPKELVPSASLSSDGPSFRPKKRVWE